MRGRPNDPAKARAKVRAHAHRAYWCDCGEVVYGNGGKSAHKAKHARRADGHRYISRDEWQAKFNPPAPKCPCIHYESYDGQPYSACTCGHPHDDHMMIHCDAEALTSAASAAPAAPIFPNSRPLRAGGKEEA